MRFLQRPPRCIHLCDAVSHCVLAEAAMRHGQFIASLRVWIQRHNLDPDSRTRIRDSKCLVDAQECFQDSSTGERLLAPEFEWVDLDIWAEENKDKKKEGQKVVWRQIGIGEFKPGVNVPRGKKGHYRVEVYVDTSTTKRRTINTDGDPEAAKLAYELLRSEPASSRKPSTVRECGCG